MMHTHTPSRHTPTPHLPPATAPHASYFLYTPLLPAVAVGTMEERSIVEPVRNLVLGKVRVMRV